MRRFLFLFLLVGLSYLTYSKEIVVVFYEQELSLEYDESIISKKKLKPDEKGFKTFYEAILKSRYQSLVDGLEHHKKNYNLMTGFTTY